MAAIDPIRYEPLCKLFPEMTQTQAINTSMYSAGSTHAEIAELRGISSNAVRQSLNAAQKNLGVTSSGELRTIFLTRLLIDMYLKIEILNSSSL